MASPRALSPCSESERAYRTTCTLPPMPKGCPECKAKVKLCHVNVETNDGMFVCTNTQCSWPFTQSGVRIEEFSGFSDVKLYHNWQEELKKKKRRNKKVLHSHRTSLIWGSSRFIEQYRTLSVDRYHRDELTDEVDINKQLPKEIVEQILLRLPFSVLRSTVPFVCKSWARYVQSIAFWRTYIRNETPYSKEIDKVAYLRVGLVV